MTDPPAATRGQEDTPSLGLSHQEGTEQPITPEAGRTLAPRVTHDSPIATDDEHVSSQRFDLSPRPTQQDETGPTNPAVPTPTLDRQQRSWLFDTAQRILHLPDRRFPKFLGWAAGDTGPSTDSDCPMGAVLWWVPTACTAEGQSCWRGATGQVPRRRRLSRLKTACLGSGSCRWLRHRSLTAFSAVPALAPEPSRSSSAL